MTHDPDDVELIAAEMGWDKAFEQWSQGNGWLALRHKGSSDSDRFVVEQTHIDAIKKVAIIERRNR